MNAEIGSVDLDRSRRKRVDQSRSAGTSNFASATVACYFVGTTPEGLYGQPTPFGRASRGYQSVFFSFGRLATVALRVKMA
jgi:hypothetical protein